MNKLLLFVFLCLPARLIIAYIGQQILNTKYRYYYSIFTLIVGISFFYQYFTNHRKFGVFSQRIWWSNYRIIHSFNYILYSLLILLFNKPYKYSYFSLYLDVIISILFYIIYYMDY